MFDEFGRPDWDTYYLSIALVASSRSLDPHTKHGCVIVDENGSILSTGYNSPPQNLDDSKVPQTRPDKYDWFNHSEENAICNAAANGGGLKNCTVYVTGQPCNVCFRNIMRLSPKRLVYGGVVASMLKKEAYRNKFIDSVMDAYKGEFEVVQFSDHDDIIKLLKKTIKYYKGKIKNGS